MKRLLCTFAAAAALLTAPAFSLAVEDKTAEEHTEGAGREVWKNMLKIGTGDDEYAAIKAELDATSDELTDEQETSLKNRLKARRQELAEWDETHAKEVREIASRYEKARREKDDGGKDAAIDDLRDLLKQRLEVQDELDRAVLGVLTDSQRERWEAARVKQRAFRLYDTDAMELSDAQENSIATRARMTAEEIGGLEADDLAGRREKVRAFYKGIEEEVLTDSQREKLEKSRKLAIDNLRYATKKKDKKLGESMLAGEEEEFTWRYLYSANR